MPSLADDIIHEVEEVASPSQPSSAKTEVFCDYLPISAPEASSDVNNSVDYDRDDYPDYDDVVDGDSATDIPEVEVSPMAPKPAQEEEKSVPPPAPVAPPSPMAPPSPAGRDAAALGAPHFNRARNVSAGPPASDWASLLFEDMPGDKQSPNNGTFDKASVDKSPTGVKKRDFLTDSALFEDDSDDDVPTLREQMTSVARTLGVTLGLELEVVSDDDIEGYDARLPKGYPEGTATLFVKEVFVAGAAYESNQVHPGDFVTALSSVPIEKVTIEFVSKKIRDFVGVASRQSVIDSSVQIPEIDGLPLHLGLLRLTGDKLYPDTALVFRAMLLKRMQAQLHEQEATAYKPTPEPEIPSLPGHDMGLPSHATPFLMGHDASPPPPIPLLPGHAASADVPLQALRASPAPLNSMPSQFGAPGFTTSASPSPPYERKVVPQAASPVRSSPMATRGVSPHLLSPSWADSPSGTTAIDRWLPNTPSSALSSSALNSSHAHATLRTVASPFSISGAPDAPKSISSKGVPLTELGKVIDLELEAAMKQLEAVENGLKEM